MREVKREDVRIVCRLSETKEEKEGRKGGAKESCREIDR